VRIEAIIAGACAFLLLLAVSQVAAPQQGAPTWNVGDTWAMGARDIDLTPIFTAIIENMQQLMPGINYTTIGKMSFYMIYKVVEADAQQYKVSVTENAEMTMTINISGSFSGQQVSGSMDMTMIAKVHGTLYFTKDDIKLTRVDVTIENMNMTLSGSGAGASLGVENFSGLLDMSGNMSATFDPPSNLFDFPISVGDSWAINSTATLTGEITGKFNTPLIGEQSISIPLNAVMPISLSASCPGTKNFTLPDGSTTNAYEIVYSGTAIAGANPFIPASIIYYSPDSEFIVSQEVSFGDAMSSITVGTQNRYSSLTLGATSIENRQPLFAMNPMTEQEAISGASGVGASGLDMVVIAIVVTVVVVVVVAVTIALLIRWRSAIST
jgi:hypothetical protein